MRREERRGPGGGPEGGPQVVLPGLPERRGQRRGNRPDNGPRGGGGGVPAGLRRAVGVHHGAGGPGPLPGPGRGVRDAALVSREPGQEEGGLGAQPWATTHHRKHDQPEGGSIVPPSGTDSKGGNDDGTERTCGEGQGPEGAQADGRGAGGGDSGYRGRDSLPLICSGDQPSSSRARRRACSSLSSSLKVGRQRLRRRR